ncbi:hypothetical protein [Halobellus rubicundus]|uniref:DUF2206 domain-containing protein n=1 Tax=Halobellus rubicundus TaxID=2996466 RepID=A0ABD5MHJ1_9EURY
MEPSISRSVVRWATARQRWTQETHLLGVAIALFGSIVFVDITVVDVGLLRPVIVVPVLSLVPGYLSLRLLQIDPRETTIAFLYSLGLSLCLLMGYGVVLNTFLPAVGIDPVFREGILLVMILAGLGVLLWAHTTRNDSRTVVLESIIEGVWHPWPLGLLCVPFAAILGARLVTRFGNNSLILIVLTGLGFIAIAAYLGYLPERFFPLAIWVIAVSLLLHNSVLTHVLAWDAPKELRLATLVVENGVWDASIGGKWMKNAMLRIVLLHPIYSVLADLSLLWEFKTVSPILFSFAPVAFYKSYQAVVDRRDAFIAALLPMSFFSFFTVLSWNSRTNGALLFLSLVAVTIVDRNLTRSKRRLLTFCFLGGLVVSHYGTAYIVLAAVGLVLVGNWILFGPTQTNRYAHTSTLVVLVFGLIVFLWYVFIVYRAGAFARVVSFSYGFFTDLWRDFYGQSAVVSAQDSTTTKYVVTQYTSDTIRWLKSLNIALGAFAGISIGALGLRRFVERLRRGVLAAADNGSGDQLRVRVEYLLYSAAFLGVFGGTFVGVDKLNTARTLMPALLFFAPFLVLTIRNGLTLVARYVDRDDIRRMGRIAALGFVLAYFVLNVGLYGSVTNEYHPNILIDKGEVIEDGNLAQKKYFWSMYYDTIYDIRASEFLDSGDRGGEAYHHYSSQQVISGMYNCTDISREPIVRQGSCDSRPARPVDQMNKIYASAGSDIYYNRSSSFMR